MTLAIFRTIYYLGLAVFCFISLLTLRHINRFSYLGRASRPVMVLYLLIVLIIIVLLQLHLRTIDWSQPLFG